MNGRERILRTIAGQTVDRPPVAPFLHMNFVKEFRQSNDVDVVAETVAIYQELDLDLIHRNCTPDYDDFTIKGPEWTAEVTEQHGPDWTETAVTVHTPGGPLRRVTRTGRLYEYESSYFLVEPPIKSPADLELCQRYQPPVPPIDTSSIVRARQLVGDAGITAPWAQGAFNEVAFLVRGSAILLDPLDDEGFYRALIRYFLERNLQKLRQFVEAGADFISLGGNEANGTCVGPDYFRAHVLEHETRLMSALHQMGGRAIYHNCGRAALLLPVLRHIGMDIYESLTPAPFGDTQLEAALEIMEGIPLMGGLDQIQFLRKATPAEVQQRVRQMAHTVADHRRFILGTSDYINENTPVENLRAMRTAVEDL
jgi:uroporphyrinogen-III decarboxylase